MSRPRTAGLACMGPRVWAHGARGEGERVRAAPPRIVEHQDRSLYWRYTVVLASLEIEAVYARELLLTILSVDGKRVEHKTERKLSARGGERGLARHDPRAWGMSAPAQLCPSAQGSHTARAHS